MTLKRSIVSGLHAAGAFGVARRLRRSRFRGVTTLVYHRVLPPGTPRDHPAALMGDPTAPQLTTMLRYLKRHFKFTTPAECVNRWDRGLEAEPYSMLLTFDDGYADLHSQLLPVLRAADVPATVFVTTGAIDGRPVWFQRFFAALARTRCERLPTFQDSGDLPLRSPADRVEAIERVSAAQRDCLASEWEAKIDRLCVALGWDGDLDDQRMMTWPQVHDLHASGLVTIGGHTDTHPCLDKCEPAAARREVEDCASALRQQLPTGSFVPFSYPHGRCPSLAVQAMVRQAGFGCAFTGRPAANDRSTPRYALGRRHVPPGDVARASFLLSGLRRDTRTPPVPPTDNKLIFRTETAV